jgi:ATP-binding cassette subfamily B multidrug efflux pump
MIARMFRWLEHRVESFPAEQPSMPPASFWGFVFHYTRPFWPLIGLSAALSATIALIEVSLFGFLGHLVDWLSKADRATFWETHGTFLLGMSAVVLLVLPTLKFFYESVVHQGLISSFTMRTRWQAHRYVLRQSMAFFNNDFAGRVATKVMQTAMSVREQLRLVTLLTVALNCLNAALLFSVAATSLWLWSIDAVTTGAIALSVGLVLRLQGMSHWIMWEVAGLFENVGVVQDGLETIAQERSIIDVPDAKKLVVTKGEIQFDHIRFNYGRDVGTGRGSVIEDLSLRVAPGEKVGLVGRSGAGKSTLVSLLLRFYDLDGGKVLIDGQDVAHVTQDSLRAQIGMVTQDTSLLHRSVMENILYGRPDAVEADAIAAAKKAAAHDFINNLEDLKDRSGYEAHVGERGVKLSGGQRQRVAIARVLLKDAPILVLDEATSALDSEVEAAIQEQLVNLMKGKTVIAIAHRLSTIAAMDRLIIMDEGRIVEQGTHADLLRRGGLYAELWARQSGGFLAQDAAE